MTPEVPPDWEQATIRDVVDPKRKVTYGIVQPGGQQSTGVPIIRGKDYSSGRVDDGDLYLVKPEIAAAYGRSMLKGDDILLSIVGYLGLVAMVPPHLEGANITQTTARIAIRPPNSPSFFFQQFQGSAFSREIRRFQKGSAQAGLNLKDVEKMQVLLPPPPEQRKIAAILSSVDAVIEQTEAVIEQLQIVKKAMMQELLTRGLPGRHTEFKPLECEWRLGRIAQGVQEIPISWSLVPIASVARLESGHTPNRKIPEYWDGDVAWVSLHDSKKLDVPLIAETTQTISEQGLANSSARLLPAGTVVFSRTATVGKAAVLGREMATSQDFANYVCGEQLHNRYLMHVFRHMQPEWKRLMAGSTHQTIYMPVFRELQILLPPHEEQARIAAVADAADERIACERDVIVELHQSKAALMSVLLTGEVRVQPDEEVA